MRSFPFALATALVTACAADPAATTEPGGGKADGAGASLTFAADFTQTLHGTLRAGDAIAIDYDLDRLQACRGSTNGSDAWGVSGYAQFDGAAPVPFAVSAIERGTTRPVTAQLHVPATARSVAIWFEQTDVFGCHAYDSNESANYTYDVAPTTAGAVLEFTDTFAQSAPVHAGDRVVVHYDPARLATCAGSTGGHAAWGVSGFWQVDGGSVHGLAVATATGSELVAADPSFAVPRGRDLALWFEATSVWGCHAYDSANGANYHVAIEN